MRRLRLTRPPLRSPPSAELFCALCADFVYDAGFDRAVAGSRAAAAAAQPQPQVPLSPTCQRVAKRKLRGWEGLTEPLGGGQVGKGGGGEAPSLAPLPPAHPPLGLRGLNNLGNTCFAGAVLQAVLALPPLRAHFLAAGHCAPSCAARRAARGAAPGASPCLACALDGVFAAAFAPPGPSGGRPPFSPAALLATWWRGADALASYVQHDAHEFFLSLLAGVHAGGAGGRRGPTGSLPSPRGGGDEECGCVVHAAFGGSLRSDLVCTACGGVSTSEDLFVDISLELPRTGPATLASCLARFARPERLGGPGSADGGVACGRCAGRRPGTKQLSLAALPPALCLHLKRFAHRGGAQTDKLDGAVAFPLNHLDLTPYLASTRLAARGGHRLPAPPPPPASYWLAGLVVHAGHVSGGHYVAYVRHGGRWYRCDDAWVGEVAEAEVRAQQAYLLFYASHAATSPA